MTDVADKTLGRVVALVALDLVTAGSDGTRGGPSGRRIREAHRPGSPN